jgi:hypothetical protein
MKNLVWIIKTELIQNKILTLFLCGVAILLGISLSLAWQAESEIYRLFAEEKWNADLIVLPKGITLQDFRQEILSGVTTDFLPEVMFDSVKELAQHKFELNAILSLTDNGELKILTKGDNANIGLANVLKKRPNLVISPWVTQNIYSTPEWSNKVIAGFFAAGSESLMMNLKNFIDKKTVGQAILIKSQEMHDQSKREQLQAALTTFAIIIGSFLFITLFSLGSILVQRLSTSLIVLRELGFIEMHVYRILFGIIIILLGLPAFLGFWASLHYFF